MKPPAGNEGIIYNPEKTLCDILVSRSGVEQSVISESFKIYAKKKSKNIPLLSEYAKVLRVDEKVRTYSEVLL